MIPSVAHARHHPQAPRLQRRQGPTPAAAAPDRGPGPRRRADGRRGPVLHRRRHPDHGGPGGAGQGRTRAAGRPRRPLHPRRGVRQLTRAAHRGADGGGRAPDAAGLMELPVLRGERVTLRPVAEADLDDLVAIVQSPAVREWWPSSVDPERTREELRSDDATYWTFAIEVDG